MKNANSVLKKISENIQINYSEVTQLKAEIKLSEKLSTPSSITSHSP